MMYFVVLKGLGRLGVGDIGGRNVEVDRLSRRLGGDATREVAGEIVVFASDGRDNVVVTIVIGGCARGYAGVYAPIIDSARRKIACAIEDALDM